MAQQKAVQPCSDRSDGDPACLRPSAPSHLPQHQTLQDQTVKRWGPRCPSCCASCHSRQDSTQPSKKVPNSSARRLQLLPQKTVLFHWRLLRPLGRSGDMSEMSRLVSVWLGNSAARLSDCSTLVTSPPWRPKPKLPNSCSSKDLRWCAGQVQPGSVSTKLGVINPGGLQLPNNSLWARQTPTPTTPGLCWSGQTVGPSPAEVQEGVIAIERTAQSDFLKVAVLGQAVEKQAERENKN